MTGIGLSIGLGLSNWPKVAGGGIPPWVEPGSVMDADFANDRYFWDGIAYGSEASFLSAIGGSQVGSTRTIGPYIDPAETNLLTNGDFAGGVAGWTAAGTGSSINGVAGELELTASGSLNAFSQEVSGAVGRAFRFRGAGRRGTTPNSLQFRLGTTATLATAEALGSLLSSTSPTAIEVYLSGRATNYIGARNTSSTGTGTAYFDNLSLIEVRPFNGWTPNAISFVVDATAPISAAGDEVVLQADANSESARIRVLRRVSDDHVVVVVTVAGSEQASLDLGAVADGANFSVAVSAEPSRFSASLNGGLPVSDITGICPGASHLRIGRSFTGDTWTGSIERVTVF